MRRDPGFRDLPLGIPLTGDNGFQTGVYEGTFLEIASTPPKVNLARIQRFSRHLPLIRAGQTAACRGGSLTGVVSS